MAAATAGLLAVPQLVLADDVQEQLRVMQQRMQQLEDKLQAASDQLDQANSRVTEQQAVIQKAGLNDDHSALSSLSKFLDQTEFNGVVAASYNWNFQDPDSARVFGGTRGGSQAVGENQNALGLGAPFHRFHNNFQLDQALISMSKASTAESRAGFGVDVAWGVMADDQSGLVSGNFSSNDTFLYQAYATYLAALGDGVQVKAGKFGTPIGAEAYRTDQNWNITNGLVWQLQPVTHTGVMLTGNLAGGFYWGVGAVNNVDNTINAGLDTNNVKTALVQGGYQADKYKIQVTGLIGSGDTGFIGGLTNQPPNSDEGLLYYTDLVATYTASDALSMWLNFDWITQTSDQLPGDNRNIYAMAVAGRLKLTEKTGFATRFEFVKGAEICGAGVCAGLLPGANDDVNLYSLTGTLDHALTDDLTVRAELRWDRGEADGTGDNFFIRDDGAVFSRQSRTMALAQMLYKF